MQRTLTSNSLLSKRNSIGDLRDRVGPVDLSRQNSNSGFFSPPPGGTTPQHPQHTTLSVQGATGDFNNFLNHLTKACTAKEKESGGARMGGICETRPMLSSLMSRQPPQLTLSTAGSTSTHGGQLYSHNQGRLQHTHSANGSMHGGRGGAAPRVTEPIHSLARDNSAHGRISANGGKTSGNGSRSGFNSPRGMTQMKQVSSFASPGAKGKKKKINLCLPFFSSFCVMS